ncbi:MAG: class E sortase, partial [Acidimicrobiia bacterium]|nr:class E sortase [Acidimicrobiia bacterium]
ATTTTTAPEPTTTAPAPAPTTAPIPPTTLPRLPVPVAPPPDDGSTEPLIGIGTIEIPAIGIERPMFEGIRLATIDHGPGHWPGTAMPGDLGNVVVAGHRVSHNADFAELDRLVPGDTVVLASLAGRFEYRVTSTEIVGPQAIHIVDQTFERRATLFACHPPGSIEERIVVHLELATPAA